MSNNKKAKNTGAILYTLTVLIVTAFTLLSVFFIASRKSKKPQGEDLQSSRVEVKTPSSIKKGTDEPHRLVPNYSERITQSSEIDIKENDDAPKVNTEPMYISPVSGYISRDFCPDTMIYSMTMEDYRTHNGIDIAAEIGDKVSAFSNGVVEKIYDDPMNGKTVEISHADGIVSIYQNLQNVISEDIEVGKEVKAGDVIGTVGETMITEIAEPPHLHFEITKNGERVNPTQFFDVFAENTDYIE